MDRFVIHACNDRMPYVKEYLVPSLVKQGIDANRIDIWLDRTNKGNLTACMECFDHYGQDAHGACWHMQDDLVIAYDFAERVNKLTEGIICGYGNVAKGIPQLPGGPPGYVTPNQMWYSFLCIRIPNKYAGECARWFYTDARYRNRYSLWVGCNKYDDSFWQEFLKEKYPDLKILNLDPNLVNHVDYLIGGSTVNYSRRGRLTSGFWIDHGEISDLETALKSRKKPLL